MRSTPELHKVEASVLYTLRRSNTARFSALMRPTRLESDVFKFHLRKLVGAGYVEKLEAGDYRLTQKGKEFANNIDEITLSTQKQPKLSLYLVVTRQNKAHETEYLFQMRLRNPFYGYWGCLSGPVKWGEEFEYTAAQELKKQTGLSASFATRSFLRVKDCAADSDSLLEDKLFIIMTADDSKGRLKSWTGGFSQWMTLKELKEQKLHFATTEEVLTALETGRSYATQKQHYAKDEY